MKKLIATIATSALFGALAVAGPANAAPIPFSEVVINPQGTVYKSGATTGADFKITGGVMPGPGDTTLKPTIVNDLGIPNNVNFTPDPKMPTCEKFTPEDDTNANMPYAQAIVDPDCVDAIVGNGRSDLYIAGQVSALVTDSQIVTFNGGRDNQGRVVQYIHGFSQTTNAGVNIRATVMSGNRLVMDIARLSFDSSVPTFETNIPGDIGKDKDYVQVNCPTGAWNSQSSFTIANWDLVTGDPINKETLTAEETTQPCSGVNAPKPKLKVKKVKGPKKMKAGQKKVFRLRVKNKGASKAKRIKIKTRGKWIKSKNQRVSNLGPKSAKTFRVKVKMQRKAKRGKKTKIKFKVVSKNAKNTVKKKRVRVR